MTMTPPDSDQPVLSYAPPTTRGARRQRAVWLRQFIYTFVGIVTIVAAIAVFFLLSIVIGGRP